MRNSLLLLLSLCLTSFAQVPPPPAASVAEVQAGTVKNKFVSPYTLAQGSSTPAGVVTNATGTGGITVTKTGQMLMIDGSGISGGGGISATSNVPLNFSNPNNVFTGTFQGANVTVITNYSYTYNTNILIPYGDGTTVPTNVLATFYWNPTFLWTNSITTPIMGAYTNANREIIQYDDTLASGFVGDIYPDLSGYDNIWFDNYNHPLNYTGMWNPDLGAGTFFVNFQTLSTNITYTYITNTFNVVFNTSAVCSNEYSSIEIGTAPNSTAPNNAALQNILDQATNYPIKVIVDGRYTINWLGIHSSTLIEAIPGCGFIAQNGNNQAMIGNYNWTNSYGGIQDSNITIQGLTVNAADTYQSGNGPSFVRSAFWQRSAGSGFGHGTNYTGFIGGYSFIGMKNLVLRDCRTLDYGTATSPSGGGNYGFCAMNYNSILLDHYYSDSGTFISDTPSGADGIHFNGPGTNLVVLHSYIHSGDDAVGLNADDGVGTNFFGTNTCYTPYYTGGILNGVTIDDLQLECPTGIRMLTARDLIQNVFISNVRGNCRTIRVNADAYPGGSGNDAAFPAGNGYLDNIHISNFNLKTPFDQYEYYPENHRYHFNVTNIASLYLDYITEIDPVTNNPVQSIGVVGNSAGLIHMGNCNFTSFMSDYAATNFNNSQSEAVFINKTGTTLDLRDNSFTFYYKAGTTNTLYNLQPIYLNGTGYVYTNLTGGNNSCIGWTHLFYNLDGSVLNDYISTTSTTNTIYTINMANLGTLLTTYPGLISTNKSVTTKAQTQPNP